MESIRLCCGSVLFVLLTILGCQGNSETVTTPSGSHDEHSHDEHSHDDHHDGDGHHGQHAADADQSELPDDFATAVAQVAEHIAAIKSAFQADTPQEADQAVHDAARVSELIPDLVTDTSLPTSEQEAAAEAANTVFDALNQIHQGFHSEEEIGKYEDVAEELEAAVDTLQQKAAATQSE